MFAGQKKKVSEKTLARTRQLPSTRMTTIESEKESNEGGNKNSEMEDSTSQKQGKKSKKQLMPIQKGH